MNFYLNSNWRMFISLIGIFFEKKEIIIIMKENLKKIIIGLIAGIISGLFSTGGGLILVPSFLYLLKLNPIESRATSIICILPMVIISSFFYAGANYLNWKVGIYSAIGGIVGGFIGSKMLPKIPNIILKASFAIFLLFAAIHFIR